MKSHVKYFEHGVRLGPTAYGLGVFAMREFSVHEVLGPIEGRLIDDSDYGSDYCMELGEHGGIEPDAPFRFLNHSCQPNCRLAEFEVEHAHGNSHPELWLSIVTAVAPNEQMTIDYGWSAEYAIPCRCGSPACRKWIVAAGQLTRVDKEAQDYRFGRE